MKTFRILVIWLSFTMDVQIRADVQLTHHSGALDLLNQNKSVTIHHGRPYEMPLEVETRPRGKGNFSFDGWKVAASGSTHLHFLEPGTLDLYQGKIWIKKATDENGLTINFPHGQLTSKDAEFILESSRVKTQVSVVAGQVDMVDRSTGITKQIKPGYSIALGGLSSAGKRMWSLLEPLAYDQVIDDVRSLSGCTEEEIQKTKDALIVDWETAVKKVSADRQNQIENDFKKLAEYESKVRKKQAHARRERESLRQLYRAKVLGLPDPNKEFPSASDRAPANSDF